VAHKTLLTYPDLLEMPNDRLRRELLAGELLVSPAPSPRHQDAVLDIAVALRTYAARHGGRVFVAPVDVVFTEHDVVEPDVVYVGPDRLEIVGEQAIRGVPDLVVEVLSPSSSGADLEDGEKYRLYARHSVAEYWVVDPKTARIHGYADPDPQNETYRSRRTTERSISSATLADLWVTLGLRASDHAPGDPSPR
jgi:Uma2 family endonuclease